MFHDREMQAIATRIRPVAEISVLAAVDALCKVGVESAALTGKLIDNTHKLCLGAQAHKDAKDASRTMAAFVNASYRDLSQNAEAVFDIWTRFVCETRFW